MTFLVPPQVGKVSRTKVCTPKQLGHSSSAPAKLFCVCALDCVLHSDPWPRAMAGSRPLCRSMLHPWCLSEHFELQCSGLRSRCERLPAVHTGCWDLAFSLVRLSSGLPFPAQFASHWLAHQHPTKKDSGADNTKTHAPYILALVNLIFFFLILSASLTAWSFLIDVWNPQDGGGKQSSPRILYWIPLNPFTIQHAYILLS